MPNHRELIQKINLAQSLGEIGPFSLEIPKPAIIYGTGEQSLIFRGREPIEAINDAVDGVWRSDAQLNATLSRNTFDDRIKAAVRECKLTDTQITPDIVNLILTDLRAKPITTTYVIRRINGVKFEHGNDTVSLGPFTIFDVESNPSAIASIIPTQGRSMFNRAFQGSKYVIAVANQSRENERAKELADEQFGRFENTVRFMIGDASRNYDVGIFNYNQLTSHQAFIASENNVGFSGGTHGAFFEVSIDAPFFMLPDAGHDKIWSIIGNASRTAIQNQILAAIDWIGKGIRDLDSSRAFVQFIFALEALLTFQPRGVLVSPGIAAQISEFCAFILGDNRDRRLEIESLTRDLYSTRSAVAHGGAKSVTKEDEHTAFALVKSLITKLLTTPELAGISDINGLKTLINNLKYG